jgi:hypothetical protein
MADVLDTLVSNDLGCLLDKLVLTSDGGLEVSPFAYQDGILCTPNPAVCPPILYLSGAKYSLPAAPIVARIKTVLQAFEEDPVFRGTVSRNVPLPTLPCVATVRLKPECIEVSLGHELLTPSATEPTAFVYVDTIPLDEPHGKVFMGVLARTTMPWDAFEQSVLITIQSALDEADSERNMHLSGLIQSILKTIATSVGLDINHVLRGMELERQCSNCLLWNAKQRCKGCKATYFCSQACIKSVWKTHKLCCGGKQASSSGQEPTSLLLVPSSRSGMFMGHAAGNKGSCLLPAARRGDGGSDDKSVLDVSLRSARYRENIRV